MENQNTDPQLATTPISQLDSKSPVGENVMSEVNTNNLVKPVNFRAKGTEMKASAKLGWILLLIAIVAGVGTGFGLQKLSAKTGLGGVGTKPISSVPTSSVKEGDVFGSADESTFKDYAEGYLEMGGVDGEGSHKLLRPGGDSQTVYLTSSVTDLDKFVGMEVKVWGETFKAQKAGWLMDVGRIQVTNVSGTAPSEE